jgi:hypothetical protein
MLRMNSEVFLTKAELVCCGCWDEEVVGRDVMKLRIYTDP